MSVNRRVDQICDEFEARWNAKEQPSVFDFLKLAARADQVVLLRELLALDIEYRTRLAIPVVAQEYAVFGQKAVRLARKTIAELRSSELNAEQSGGDDTTFVSEKHGFVDEAASRIRYFGDYELLNEFARGGM